MQNLRGGQNFSFPTLLDSYRELLLKMTSRPGFFNSGKTKAPFQTSGKHPDCNDLLLIFVRTGRISSHLLTSVDGIGSRMQDLRAEFWISCITSRTDSIVKVRNDGTDSSRTYIDRYFAWY